MTAPPVVEGGDAKGGRIVLVTGASSGIGAATARALAVRGTTVALVARRADRLDQVLADCLAAAPVPARPPSARPPSARWAADLAEPQRAADLARDIWDHYGRLDVVVNNAGAPMRRPVTRLTMAEVERTVRLNYLSPVAVTLAVLPRMLARRAGTVVNVSSLGGRLGVTTESAYCGSKFALAGWTEAAAADLAGTGVELKLVLPGAIDTEIWDQPDNDPPVYTGPLVPAAEVADGIVAAIDSDRFEHYLPDMKAVVQMKTDDIDAFFDGMRAMAAHELDEAAVADVTLGHAGPGPLPGAGR